MNQTTKPPQTVADALNRVHGRPAAPKPENLAEAITAVRGAKPAAPIPMPPKAAGKIAEGDGLPGLRAWLAERRNGRR